VKKWFKELFSDWLTSRPKLMALSLILAIIVWSFVALSVNSITTRTIDNVPVEIPSTGASYQSLGLDIIDNGETEYTASVTVSGDRGIIGNLTADSFTVTPDFSKVTEAGTYNITLTAAKNNPLLDYEIKSVTPTRIVLTFGESVTRKFTVTPVVTGFTVADGYVVLPAVASPASVTVVGNRETVDSIRKVTAELTLSGEVRSSVNSKGTIHLYDENENEISADLLRLDTDTVDLLVPVYRKGIMEFDIEFTNVPSGFDTSILKYTLSPAQTDVAYTGNAASPDSVRTIGYVDMATLDLGGTYEFEVKLPSAYVDLDGVDTVSVSFASEGLSSQKMNVTDIRTSNVPDGYEVKIITEKIQGVTVIGETAELAKLVSGSVVAVVDCSQLKAENGYQSVPVSIIIPSSSSVWAVGSYSVSVEVTRK